MPDERALTVIIILALAAVIAGIVNLSTGARAATPRRARTNADTPYQNQAVNKACVS